MHPLVAPWSEAWPGAQLAWSRFVRLRAPLLCEHSKQADKEGLRGGIAMIRLDDHRVVIDLTQIQALGLDGFPTEILAHEIGHHLFVPADLSDHGRLLVRVRRGLPGHEGEAPLIANLYADLLINDRLQRQAELDMAGVYRQLVKPPKDAGKTSPSALWQLYLRIYEQLWRLPKGDLNSEPLDDVGEGDALLGAELIRVYANDWLRGAGGFAALCLPYLMADKQRQPPGQVDKLMDLDEVSGAGGMPDGLAEIEDDEAAVHPADDPKINPERQSGKEQEGDGDSPAQTSGKPKAQSKSKPGGGQRRSPFEYGQILKQLGLDLSATDVAARYYSELARRHLVRFPQRIAPESTEPQLEGTEPWQPGEPLEQIDWLESLLRSPVVVPGYTTVQRTYGHTQGSLPERTPVDLDLYVDCSGSMPNPQQAFSAITLAGAIVCLSAFKAGAKVQATLWSGAGQYQSTPGFVRDKQAVLRVLTGYLGGSTQFPLNVMRDTYDAAKRLSRPVHLLVLSDSGVDTILGSDERGNKGTDLLRRCLARAGGGMTLALNVHQNWKPKRLMDVAQELKIAVHRVQSWDDLVAFARAFSQASYADEGPGQTKPRKVQ